jgi:hypothetical protein
MTMRTDTSSDQAYFAAHKTKGEYVRAPLPGEFDGVAIPPEARVRVFLINGRSLVKALELPSGERLATVLEVDSAKGQTSKAA